MGQHMGVKVLINKKPDQGGQVIQDQYQPTFK